MNTTHALVAPQFRKIVSIWMLGLVLSLLHPMVTAQTAVSPSQAPTETSEVAKESAAPSVTTASQTPLFDQGQLAQTALGLFFVIALLFGLLWFVKRMGLNPGNRPGSFYKVLSVSSLGPKEKIALLEVGETWLVVGMTQHSINTLHTLPKGSLDWSKNQTTASEAFSRMLEKMKTPQAKP